MNPENSTIAWLKDYGFEAGTVEIRVTRIISRDLFGCIDVIGVHPVLGVVGVQATSPSNMAAREVKVKSSRGAQILSGLCHKVYVVGWEKKKPFPRVVEMIWRDGAWDRVVHGWIDKSWDFPEEETDA